MRTNAAVFGVVVACLAFAPSSSGEPLTPPVWFEVVALSGQEAPGIPGSRFFPPADVRMNRPPMGASGAMAFDALIEGDGITESNDSGIWAIRSAVDTTLRLVVREGDPAPGTQGAFFGPLGPRSVGPPGITVSATGAVVFGARLVDGVGDTTIKNNRGVWIATPNASGSYDIALVARRGDPVPGTNGATFDRFTRDPLTNARGDVLLWAVLNGDLDLSLSHTQAANEGLWMSIAPDPVRVDRTLALVMRAGDPAPDTGAVFWGTDRYTLSDIEYLAASLNDVGEVAFSATTLSPINLFDGGIWVGPPGAVQLRTCSSDPCPGAGGHVFADFGKPVLNNEGDFAFRARLADSAISPPSNQGALCASYDGELRLIALDGAPAPGFPGQVFSRQMPGIVYPRINARGDLACTTGLSEAPNAPGSALWTSTRDTNEFRPIAIEGDDRFGFGPFQPSPPTIDTQYNNFTLNARGDVAFSNVADPETDPSPTLWMHAHTGYSPFRICDPGRTVINVAPKTSPPDPRVVAELVTWDGGNYPPPAFNDFGDVAFTARFTDDSYGVIVAHTRREPRTLSPADLDGDDVVDANDFTILAAQFGTVVEPGTGADITGDGVVNAADFAVLAREFGRMPIEQ